MINHDSLSYENGQIVVNTMNKINKKNPGGITKHEINLILKYFENIKNFKSIQEMSESLNLSSCTLYLAMKKYKEYQLNCRRVGWLSKIMEISKNYDLIKLKRTLKILLIVLHEGTVEEYGIKTIYDKDSKIILSLDEISYAYNPDSRRRNKTDNTRFYGFPIYHIFPESFFKISDEEMKDCYGGRVIIDYSKSKQDPSISLIFNNGTEDYDFMSNFNESFLKKEWTFRIIIGIIYKKLFWDFMK